MTTLLTGTTGFIGTALAQHLYRQTHPVIAAVRRITDTLPSSIQQIPIGDLLPDTAWSATLEGVDTVVHLAARNHVMRDNAADSLAAYRETNTVATLNLAQQAAAVGVKRFIFLSSIKVNGEQTFPNQPFTANIDNPPTDPYAASKWEAEQGLKKISQQTGLEVVIIRPPLVYGAGVKGNFRSMMGWLYKGIPLPLGSIHNQRSLVALPNLIDLITTCIDHPAAANQTFLVCDGEDLSTTDLLRRLASAMGKPARLLPIPQKLLETGLSLLGKPGIARRLCGNLQIDMTHTCQTLGWQPPISVDAALHQTADTYLAQHLQNT